MKASIHSIDEYRSPRGKKSEMHCSPQLVLRRDEKGHLSLVIEGEDEEQIGTGERRGIDAVKIIKKTLEVTVTHKKLSMLVLLLHREMFGASKETE